MYKNNKIKFIKDKCKYSKFKKNLISCSEYKVELDLYCNIEVGFKKIAKMIQYSIE
jgi:hypothetical protein